jgi:hypothetical protein
VDAVISDDGRSMVMRFSRVIDRWRVEKKRWTWR